LAKNLRAALLATAIFVIAPCAIAPAAALAGTLDQQQPGTTATAISVYADQSVAQTFTAGVSGGLDQVDLLFGTSGGTPTTYLSVEIRDVSAGAPGDMILASHSLPASAVPALADFVPITFSPPAPVLAGTQYAIVAYASNPNPSPGYSWSTAFSAMTDFYAGGATLTNPVAPPSGAWTGFGGFSDGAFKTYVVPSPPAAAATPPAPTGRRAAALKKCKHKPRKKRKSCRRKANLLPV
jgi:hypothetical protein